MVLLVYCSDEHLILISPNPGKLGGSINIHFVQDSDRLSHRNGPTPKTLKNNNPPKKDVLLARQPFLSTQLHARCIAASTEAQAPEGPAVINRMVWYGCATPRALHELREL